MGDGEELVGAHGAQLLAPGARVPRWLAEAGSRGGRLGTAHSGARRGHAETRQVPRCVRLAAKDFCAVERFDEWRFPRRHDAPLELELLHLLKNAG